MKYRKLPSWSRRQGRTIALSAPGGHAEAVDLRAIETRVKGYKTEPSEGGPLSTAM